jgi:hypothetical protein
MRDRCDEYIGTLVNAYLAAGGEAAGVRAGSSYVDVGTLHGYREAIQLLSGEMQSPQLTIVPHIALSRVAAAPLSRGGQP